MKLVTLGSHIRYLCVYFYLHRFNYQTNSAALIK